MHEVRSSGVQRCANLKCFHCQMYDIYPIYRKCDIYPIYRNTYF